MVRENFADLKKEMFIDTSPSFDGNMDCNEVLPHKNRGSYISRLIDSAKKHKLPIIGTALGLVTTGVIYAITKDTAYPLKLATVLIEKLQHTSTPYPFDINPQFCYFPIWKEYVADTIGAALPPIVGGVCGSLIEKRK
jgi:hypothetical protein